MRSSLSRRRGTVRRSIGNDCRSDDCATCAVCAVPQSVIKVHVLAQASGIRTRAAQRRILSFHVVEARLTAWGQCGETRRSGSVCCECRRAVCAAARLNKVSCYGSEETTESIRTQNAAKDSCGEISGDLLARNYFHSRTLSFPCSGGIGSVDITPSLKIKSGCSFAN